MRKEPGTYFIELYDELGHKVDTVNGISLTDSQKIADNWESQKDGYSAVAHRIVYNTKMKLAKYT